MPWSRFDGETSAPTGGRSISYCAAIREAIDQAMRLDPRVFCIGLDADDRFGVFGSMLGLTHPDRVIGTPISENAMTGVALGAALCGMRPIHVHLRNDFLLVAMDQIVNYVAKWSAMFGGKSEAPLVIRSVIGRGWGSGAQHSQSLHGLFAQIPGLQVVLPSSPYDVKGLFLEAVKQASPVLFLEHRWLYKNTGNVPEELYTLPFGKAARLRAGKGATVVAASLAAVQALKVCEQERFDVDLIDPRTIKPLDLETIVDSVRRTGRLLVIDHDFPFGGFAAEVLAAVSERAFASLTEAPLRLAFPDRSMPASGVLERAYYPTPERIGAALRSLLQGAERGSELVSC